MQFFEVLLFMLSIIMLVMLRRGHPVKRSVVLSTLSLAVAVLTIHIVFEDPRWQLYLLYAALMIAGFLLYVKTVHGLAMHRGLETGLFAGLGGLTFLAFILTMIFPLYALPEPGGDYAIGTESFTIENSEHYERYGDDPGTHRTFKIQLWYPADNVDGYEQSPWLEDGTVVSRALSRDVGLPFFMLDHTADIQSNAYSKAPISREDAHYPVVVLSHGWRGFRNLHTDIAEELASQGYVVVGIDHAYGSVATVLDDKTIYLDPEALPKRETTPDFLDYAQQLVDTYASDIHATLDYLEAMNENDHFSQFSGMLDLEHVGLIGHSTGGGADVVVALDDGRIDAVIGLDAWVEPIEEAAIEEGLTMPSLFLRSGDWEESYNNAHLYTLIEKSTGASTLYQIDGTTHSDFAMVYMVSPLTGIIGFSGDVESERLTPMLKSMVNDFFDGTLNDEPGRGIDPDTWEEVRPIDVK